MFYVNREELIHALTVAKGFATKDSTVPILAAVRLTVRGNHLVATATDRYKLVESRVAVTSEDGAEGFDAVIPVSMVPTVVAAVKATGKTVPVGVERVTVGLVRICGVDVYEVAGEYPRVEKLWPDELPTGGTFSVGDGAVFGLLKARTRRHPEPLRVFPQDNESRKGLVAMRGDHTRALVMPLRDQEELGPVWADWQAA